MTIQVYTLNEQGERALLAFLDNGHYNYKSTEEDTISDVDFLKRCNQDLDEAEAEIEKFVSHNDVKKNSPIKRDNTGRNQMV